MKATDHVPRQQRLLFMIASEQRRAARLVRIAQLKATGVVTTGQHLFTEAAAREADRRARAANESK